MFKLRTQLCWAISLSLVAGCQFPTMQNNVPKATTPTTNPEPNGNVEDKLSAANIQGVKGFTIGPKLSEDGRPLEFARPTAKLHFLRRKKGQKLTPEDMKALTGYKTLSHTGDCPPGISWRAIISKNLTGEGDLGIGLDKDNMVSGFPNLPCWDNYQGAASYHFAHMYYVTEDIGEVYVCYWNWEPDLFSYNGYIVFEPLHPSPSPTPSPSPSPDPTPDPTPVRSSPRTWCKSASIFPGLGLSHPSRRRQSRHRLG